MDAVGKAVDDLEPSILVGEGEGALERGPHSLIGNKVDTRTYRKFKCCFLSREIWTEALKALQTKNKNLAQYVFSKLETAHIIGGLLHEAFKYLAREELCRQQVRFMEPLHEGLGQSPMEELRLQESTKAPISRIEDADVNYPAPIMWVPTSERFPVVDFIYTQPAPPNSPDRDPIVIGFQMTVRDQHPINHACLQRLVDKFGDRFKLIFALPRTIYSKFKKQNQLDSQGRKIAENLYLPVAQFKTCSFVDLFPIQQ